jgi:hypothetical protein
MWREKASRDDSSCDTVMEVYETMKRYKTYPQLLASMIFSQSLIITWSRGREVSNQYHGSREFVASSDLAVLMQEKLSVIIYLP